MLRRNPCITVQPGAVNPFPQLEVFVTNDSAETDLGHSQRSISCVSHSREAA